MRVVPAESEQPVSRAESGLQRPRRRRDTRPPAVLGRSLRRDCRVAAPCALQSPFLGLGPCWRRWQSEGRGSGVPRVRKRFAARSLTLVPVLRLVLPPTHCVTLTVTRA